MPLIDARVLASALRILARGDLARYYSAGISEVQSFERELGRFLGVAHTLGVNSGTSALVCALAGLGIGPGDEVLVPAYTWVASAAAPLLLGAVPVLTEIDRSLTIDPEDIERKLSPHTKAIIVVHMLNLPCDMDRIMAIAKRRDLLVIEDACQAIGVTYRGRRLGSIGHVGAFSFQLNKNIQCGEGGAVVSNSDRVYNRALMYHDVGSYMREGRVEPGELPFVGQNYRMPNLSAAILRPQLKRLDAQLEERRRRRRFWLDKLGGRSARFRASPHNDEPTAAGLTVYFEDPAEAKAFSGQRGVDRLIDTDRHVYTNWASVLSGASVHPKLDPYAWAPRDVRIRKDSCPRTLEILERTCHVKLFPEIPFQAYKRIVAQTSR